MLIGSKDLRLALPQSPPEQGLREVVCQWPGLRIRGRVTLSGEAVDPCLAFINRRLATVPEVLTEPEARPYGEPNEKIDPFRRLT